MSNNSFSNRWGIIFAALGMAIGAGNLWRFPRLAGQYGGTFLILWLLFLLVWSIPILLAEFSIGKAHKRGVIGSFSKAAGKNYSWMGAFIAICTLGIAFYYSVVTAWGMRYFAFSVNNVFAAESLAQKLAADPNYLETFWQGITHKNYLLVGLHFASIIIAAVVLIRGVQKGFERANKILIPTLFSMLLLIGAVALSTGNGIRGLEYMFAIKPELFSNPKIWIEALSQSAWSTGAGWGLMMTISAYSRPKEDVSLNIFISAFGNNTASIVAGVAILGSVFALASSEDAAISYLQSGNFGLTFNAIPTLFTQITGGAYLSIIFFGAFCLAAFTSFLAMLELLLKMLSDLGFDRKKAVIWGALICMVLGLPSSWSLEFLQNQDWVWGLGLIISGLFIMFAVVKYGINTFKEKYIDADSDFKVNNLYFKLCMIVNIPIGIFLIIWWMSQGYGGDTTWFDENGNWHFFDTYSNASIVTQWAAVIIGSILLNRYLYKKFGS